MIVVPRIILSLRRFVTEYDVILIDLRNKAIYYRGVCVLYWRRAGGRRLQTRFLAVSCLLCAYPHMVCHDDMIEFVCGDDPDGGPPWIRGSITATLCNAKKQLAFLGFRLVTHWGQGCMLELLPQRQRIAA